jgi:hydrogenase nickel incorporation protein HypA/HybF
MHELSIAENIVEIVKQNVSPDRLEAVRGIRLKVGNQSGVVADSLEFSYEAITSDTPLKRSALVIDRIPFILHCEQCLHNFESEYGIVLCERCSCAATIISGTELQVNEIDLED